MDLQTIRADFDATIRKALTGKPVSCRAGCSWCCKQLIYMSLAEAVDIVEHHRGRVAALRPTLERLSESLVLNADHMSYFGTPCPLLEDDRCSVYEERPITCRAHYVASPAAVCADPRGAVLKYDFREAVQKALGSAMDALPYPQSLLPIPIALLLALNAAEALERAADEAVGLDAG